ncbi:MAG TPA: GT4 family glycosyltransferase PelF [Acidimicrobiales bacterium]|nr:GT4 family glycosyltransferase PelF [Acidimicrobiales bacterium]
MRVYLSTEGTYPFVLGGVSTWVDMLLHGLPEHEFEVGALVDNPHHRIVYRPPANVTLQPIPLWGLELVEEYLPRPDGWRRALRTSSAVVRKEFLPSWEQLAECLCAPEADPRALGDGLEAVARFAERFDLRRALSDAATWALLLDRLTTNPLHARTGLAPAMDFARTMYRYLLPLTAPTPVVDVTHSSAAALCALPAVVTKYRYGTPMVLTEHGIYLRERLLALSAEPFGTKLLFANFYRAVVELAYREADMVTPVCHYNAMWEEALGVHPERIRVIHNGVDPDRVAVAGDPGDVPTVGFVGRIDPIKDVITLIRAFARVRQVMAEARLRLWGPATSPEYLEECRATVAELGLDEAVRFEGPTNDVSAAYGACHVVALSSISEAFPYTAVEAMLAARPMVATGVGGVAEAIGPCSCQGVELVVEPGDPRGMADALLAVLSAPAEERAELGAWLRRRARTLFAAQRMFDDYDDVYRTLCPLPAGSADLWQPRHDPWLGTDAGPSDHDAGAGAVPGRDTVVASGEGTGGPVSLEAAS